jgi:ubiquinone/menaquinone biosynthesis C-methylase UbiE
MTATMTETQRVNHWRNDKCAKAFWSQQDLPSYQELLSDTLDWCAPKAGERWLDLGCGGGALSRGLWERSNGSVDFILGLDCAAANESAYRRWKETLSPTDAAKIEFKQLDFSAGLGILDDSSFDHAVSGLSITYAEYYDEAKGCWTDAAYDRLLAEVARILRPGGAFTFSVNVPNPSWAKVAWRSSFGFLRSHFSRSSLKRAWRMLRYGRWLKREARAGRFHYLPAEEVSRKLVAAGFTEVKHRLSYCDQAFIFRATKPS